MIDDFALNFKIILRGILLGGGPFKNGFFFEGLCAREFGILPAFPCTPCGSLLSWVLQTDWNLSLMDLNLCPAAEVPSSCCLIVIGPWQCQWEGPWAQPLLSRDEKAKRRAVEVWDNVSLVFYQPYLAFTGQSLAALPWFVLLNATELSAYWVLILRDFLPSDTESKALHWSHQSLLPEAFHRVFNDTEIPNVFCWAPGRGGCYIHVEYMG